MIFIAGASMLKSTILLTDAMLVGVSDYSYRCRCGRMDMFNTNRENVSSFYCYISIIYGKHLCPVLLTVKNFTNFTCIQQKQDFRAIIIVYIKS